MNQDVPPLPYLIDIEGGLEGGESVKDSEGGGESTTTNYCTEGGYKGVS